MIANAAKMVIMLMALFSGPVLVMVDAVHAMNDGLIVLAHAVRYVAVILVKKDMILLAF